MRTTPDQFVNINNTHKDYTVVWLHEAGEDIDLTIDSSRFHVQEFHSVRECEDYIRQAKGSQIMLFINAEAARNIVPQIHDLEQVLWIRLYLFDPEKHKELASKYAKVSTTKKPYFLYDNFRYRSKAA
jgi:hypothetical protein